MNKQDWEKVLEVVGKGLGATAMLGIGWVLYLLHGMGRLGAALSLGIPVVALGMGGFLAFSRWYSTRQSWTTPELLAQFEADVAGGWKP